MHITMVVSKQNHTLKAIVSENRSRPTRSQSLTVKGQIYPRSL